METETIEDFRFKLASLAFKLVPQTWGLVRAVIVAEIKKASPEALLSLREELRELLR